MSNADLSEVVNLSQSACHRRVQRLESEGYIDGYVALLNSRKMGRRTTIFVEITLNGQADEVLDAFERAVLRVPEVLECHLMAGNADYLLKVVAADAEDIARRLQRADYALPEGLARVVTIDNGGALDKTVEQVLTALLPDTTQTLTTDKTGAADRPETIEVTE